MDTQKLAKPQAERREQHPDVLSYGRPVEVRRIREGLSALLRRGRVKVDLALEARRQRREGTG